MPLQLTCSCGNVLSVSESHLGKRVSCPRCKESMLVPAKAEQVARSGSSGGKGIKFVLLGLLAIVVVAGVAFTIWTLSKGPLLGPPKGPEGDGPEVSDVALLPANVQMVMTVRLAELYALPAAKDAIEKERKRDPKQEDPAARMERDTGLKPEEVERMHIVGLDIEKQQGWLVARTSEPIDRDKVLAKVTGRIEVRHEGRRYYLGKNSVNEEVAIHFAGPKVLVIGNEAGMKRAMEQATKPATEGPLKATIGLVETTKSQMIAGVNTTPEMLALVKKDIPLDMPSLGEMKTLRLTLDAGEQEAILVASAKMASAKGATQLRSSMQTLVGSLPLWALFQVAKGKEAVAMAKHVSNVLGPMKFEVKENELRGTTKTSPATMAAAILFLGARMQAP